MKFYIDKKETTEQEWKDHLKDTLLNAFQFKIEKHEGGLTLSRGDQFELDKPVTEEQAIRLYHNVMQQVQSHASR